MKNTTISVGFDEEKLAAARIYLAQKNLSVEDFSVTPQSLTFWSVMEGAVNSWWKKRKVLPVW